MVVETLLDEERHFPLDVATSLLNDPFDYLKRGDALGMAAVVI